MAKRDIYRRTRRLLRDGTAPRVARAAMPLSAPLNGDAFILNATSRALDKLRMLTDMAFLGMVASRPQPAFVFPNTEPTVPLLPWFHFPALRTSSPFVVVTG